MNGCFVAFLFVHHMHAVPMKGRRGQRNPSGTGVTQVSCHVGSGRTVNAEPSFRTKADFFFLEKIIGWFESSKRTHDDPEYFS